MRTGKASKYFTWNEILWLPKYNRLATEEDGLTEEILDRLQRSAVCFDQVRDFFNLPVNVHCWYRPPAYNILVNGAANSAHKALVADEAAIDFDIPGMTCQDVIQKILDNNLLEKFNLRMENNGPNPTWVHLDRRILVAGHPRYFLPK